MELGTVNLPPYLYNPESATLSLKDNRRFTIFSDYRPHGLFDARFYTYYLKPIDE